MKINKILLALTLCASLQLHANQNDQENKIQQHVSQILEWAATEKKDNQAEFNTTKKDTSKILNPIEGDTHIALEAKKRAKELLFPEQTKTDEPTKSYWQTYAPQFMQNTATATSDYIASYIPKSVRNTVNGWSTRKKVAVAGVALASLLAVYNRDQIMTWVSNTLAETPAQSLSQETPVQNPVTNMPKEMEDKDKLDMASKALSAARKAIRDALNSDDSSQEKIDLLKEDLDEKRNQFETLQLKSGQAW